MLLGQTAMLLLFSSNLLHSLPLDYLTQKTICHPPPPFHISLPQQYIYCQRFSSINHTLNNPENMDICRNTLLPNHPGIPQLEDLDAEIVADPFPSGRKHWINGQEVYRFD